MALPRPHHHHLLLLSRCHTSLLLAASSGEATAAYSRLLRCASPTEHTFPLLLKAVSASASAAPSDPDLVHAHICKFGFGSDAFVSNSLVCAYAKRGRLRAARQVLDGMPRPDAVSWTALLRGCVQSGRAAEGLGLFVEMRSCGVAADAVTVVNTLRASGMAGDASVGRCLHGFVECGWVRWDAYVGTALIDMYMKCGHWEDARRVFDEMPCRNVVAWSTLVSGYEQCSRFTDSVAVFWDMLIEGLRPAPMMLASVLAACAQLGALDQGRWIHEYIDRNSIELNLFIGTALVDMYMKCGCMKEALEVFHKLPRKNVYTWTVLITGLAMHGQGTQCLKLFDQMLEEKVKPNEVTLLGVLSACSHCGLVEQGRIVFDNMLDKYRIKPTLKHYGCIIDLLGRAGQMNEALSIIECMPMEPSPAVWQALLSACMHRRDFVLGKRIGEYLVTVHPSHDGGYAVLANMHSLSGKREEAAIVRMDMKEKKVEKARTCSSVEVDGVVHEFVASDASHFQSIDVYDAVHGLTRVMKMEGSDHKGPICLSRVYF